MFIYHILPYSKFISCKLYIAFFILCMKNWKLIISHMYVYLKISVSWTKIPPAPHPPNIDSISWWGSRNITLVVSKHSCTAGKMWSITKILWNVTNVPYENRNEPSCSRKYPAQLSDYQFLKKDPGNTYVNHLIWSVICFHIHGHCPLNDKHIQHFTDWLCLHLQAGDGTYYLEAQNLVL
jgi:hypothetical protein